MNSSAVKKHEALARHLRPPGTLEESARYVGAFFEWLCLMNPWFAWYCLAVTRSSGS